MRAGDARMERRPEWVGSARVGQLSPRDTREGSPATVSHLGVPAPVSSDYRNACTGKRQELRPTDVPFALKGSSSLFCPYGLRG